MGSLRESATEEEEMEGWGGGKGERGCLCLPQTGECCALFTQADPDAAELDTVLVSPVCVEMCP